jgi:hypothetical protein
MIHLGFSGNGQLEPAMIDLINEIDAKLYILDYIPNLWDKTKFSAEEIEKRMRHTQLEIHKNILACLSFLQNTVVAKTALI